MDRSVVVRAQQGDQAAFTSLMVAHAAALNRAAVGILGDRALADDAVQRALLTIWRQLPRLREPERFEAWAYRLLVRSCYAESRRQRRWLPELVARMSLDGDPFAGEEPAAPDDLAAVHDHDQLERGFHRLTVHQRAVVVLRLYLDLPADEVAEVMGVAVGTVHSRLHRALAALRAALEADARCSAVNGTSQELAR